MTSDHIARLNSVTPYYCPDGSICGGRCRFQKCPNGVEPMWGTRAITPLEWCYANIPNFGVPVQPPLTAPKPRIRVKAGSRKVPA